MNCIKSGGNGEGEPLIPPDVTTLSYRGVDSTNPSSTNGPRRRLSTFFGVVVPCVLSMFSVVLFLRMGFIVGQAGLFVSLAMLLLAYVIIGLTVLSVCAIATNGAIEGGGAYFMISRALGPEFGGAIGLMFFLANVAAAALYIFGIVEAMGSYFGENGLLINSTVTPYLPSGTWYNLGYGTGILFICFIICLVGANIYAKTTFAIFIVVIVSITSVVISFFAKKPTVIEARHTPNISICNYTEIFYTGFNKSTIADNEFARFGLDYDRNRPSSFAHTFSVFFTSKHALLVACTSVMESVSNANFTVDYSNSNKPTSFVVVFAVLFNGCTGIMAGANMSGELKNPSRSIPVGTIAACAITFFVYMILIILISASTPSFLTTINVWQPFVAIGVFLSSISATLSSFIGASRILLALARDEVFGFLLNPITKTTSGGNPYVAVLVTWLLIQLVLFAQKVNVIAPVVTIFFLFAYAAVDMSCLALDWASAPNFRPTFKYFTWYTSLLGILSCVVMMFLIEPIYTTVSFAVLVILVVVIHYRAPTTSWGYISQALIFHQVRKYMLMLDVRKEHVKFWRPQILLMVKNPRTSCQFIDFINSIKKSGLYVLGHVSLGHLGDMKRDLLQVQHEHWLNLVDALGIKAFVELTLSNSVREGTEHLLRISGLGGMKPNTLVMGFYDDSPQVDTFQEMSIFKEPFSVTDRPASALSNSSGESHNDSANYFPLVCNDEKRLSAEEYVAILVDAIKLRKNICLGRSFAKLNKNELIRLRKTPETMKYIDVWPVNFLYPVLSQFHQQGQNNPGSLALTDTSSFDVTSVFLMQMACILNMVHFWKRNTKLRINLCSNENMPQNDSSFEKLKDFLKNVRIKAEIRNVEWHQTNLLPLPQEGRKMASVIPNISNIQSDGGSSCSYDIHSSSASVLGEDPESINRYLEDVNTLLKNNVASSAVTFLYLPAPPHAENQHVDYLSMLTRISDNLGPVLFVYGLSDVVSTSL